MDARTEQVSQITREELYEQVWAEPMLKVAERLGVSSSFMARVCASMNVPRPAPGYWVKLEFGKADPKPSLPPATPADRLIWNRGNALVTAARPLPEAPTARPKDARRRTVVRAKTHHLIAGARDLFTKGRATDTGLLKPAKKLLVDMVVSEKTLDHALRTANELFLQLEAIGYRVLIPPVDHRFVRAEIDERETQRKERHYSNLWSPARPTVVFVGTVAIGLVIFEMTEEVEVRYIDGKYIPTSTLAAETRKRPIPHWSWTSMHEFTSGRLCLQAYSPYSTASWTQTWRETKTKDLRSQIIQIVTALGTAAVDVARLVAEGERKAEILQREREEEWRRYDEEQERKRRIKATIDSRQELLDAIRAWDEVKRIHAFFSMVEADASHLVEEERSTILARLALARGLIGDINPLEALSKWKAPDER